MPHILKNKHLEIQIDLPFENYSFSRFDRTGKIVSVKFQNIQLSGCEDPDCKNEEELGKGFYNEFGIDTPLGFIETPIGGWFHKIGVGLLKKDTPIYQCGKKYEIQPAKFEVRTASNALLIRCTSQSVNGYSYVLEKKIELQEAHFTIHYTLHNTGEKEMITDEYVHNFMAFDQEPIGRNDLLQFPFQLKPSLFIETVNPEQKVDLGPNGLTFNNSPQETFFFSNLSGGEMVTAQWELKNRKSNIGIRETGNFKTNKVNVWGASHVISPELFFNIAILSGQSMAWSRSYRFYELE